MGLGPPIEVGTLPDSAESHATQRVDLDSAMNESGPESDFLNIDWVFETPGLLCLVFSNGGCDSRTEPLYSLMEGVIPTKEVVL